MRILSRIQTLISETKTMSTLGNYLEIKHMPLNQATLRLTDEIFKKIAGFKRNSKSNQIDKLSYLVRLFHLSKVEVKEIPISVLSKTPRPHRAGSYLPDDVDTIVRDFAEKHNIPLAVALDVILLEGLTLAKRCELIITLSEKV